MSKKLNEQIVDSIFLQNKEGFMSAFQAAMAEKVGEALETKKIEVASNFLSVENTPEDSLKEAKVEKKNKEPEKLDEIVRLFRPGSKATVRSIDAYAFQGRDDHPPVDGSLEGHRILITGYGETNGPFGVSGDFDRNPADMRFQSVRGKVLTGQHKGKEFDFINHELLHPQVDAYHMATDRNLAEARVNHREYAAAGLMHPEMANHSSMEVGNMVDFYSRENGDKLFGEVVKNNGEAVHIREILGGKRGELHKFKVSSKLA